MGCHFLLQGIFPTQGIEPGSPALWADALLSEPPGNNIGERNVIPGSGNITLILSLKKKFCVSVVIIICLNLECDTVCLLNEE